MKRLIISFSITLFACACLPRSIAPSLFQGETTPAWDLICIVSPAYLLRISTVDCQSNQLEIRHRYGTKSRHNRAWVEQGQEQT